MTFPLVKPIYNYCDGQFGCKCPGIREVKRISLKPYPKPKAHGDRALYISGCRCRKCTAANSEYTKKYREQKAKDKWSSIQ